MSDPIDGKLLKIPNRSVFKKEMEMLKLCRKVIGNNITDKSGSFEEFVIGEKIGKGSFARCYECHYVGEPLPSHSFKKEALDEVRNQKLVVKIFKSVERWDTLYDMIKSDAQYMKYHRNVVQIICHKACNIDFENFTDFSESDKGEKTGFVLMLYHGIHLKDYLKKRNKKLEQLEILNILRDIIEGANHLHSKSKVHRDLHMENLLVDVENSRVLICDFGLTLDVITNLEGFEVDEDDMKMNLPDDEASDEDEIQTELVRGGYKKSLPPEINNGIKVFNYEKSDIFSIGRIASKLVKCDSYDHASEKECFIHKKMEEFIKMFTEVDLDKRIGHLEAVSRIIGFKRAYKILQEYKTTEKLEDFTKRRIGKELDFSEISRESRIISVLPCKGKVRSQNEAKVFFSLSDKDGAKRYENPMPSCTELKFGKEGASFDTVVKNGFKVQCPEARFLIYVIYATLPQVEEPETVDVSLEYEEGVLPLVLRNGYKYYDDDGGEMVQVDEQKKQVEEEEDEEDEIESAERGTTLSEKDVSRIFTGKDTSGDYDQNVTEAFGGNILFYAVAQNDMRLVKYLVEEKQFDPSFTDIFGFTPIFIAKCFGLSEMLDYLSSRFMSPEMRILTLREDVKLLNLMNEENKAIIQKMEIEKENVEKTCEVLHVINEEKGAIIQKLDKDIKELEEKCEELNLMNEKDFSLPLDSQEEIEMGRKKSRNKINEMYMNRNLSLTSLLIGIPIVAFLMLLLIYFIFLQPGCIECEYHSEGVMSHFVDAKFVLENVKKGVTLVFAREELHNDWEIVVTDSRMP